MGRRGPLSAAHKAAISAGLKRYWAGRKGSGSAGGGGSATKTIQNVSNSFKPISREEAARIMFGSKGAAQKLAGGKKVRKKR